MTRPPLALLAVALLAAAVGVLTWRVILARRGGAQMVAAQIGPVPLVYPPAYARFPAGREGGRLDRVELAASFPDFRPAGQAVTTLPSDDSAKPGSALIFITIRAEDEAVDPEERTEKLHARFLESGVWQEEGGLVMRRFEAGSPYEREELHFVPPDGRAFAARCLRPTQPPSDLPSTCLATIRSGGLDMDLRFPPTILPDWERLMDGARRLIQSFRNG